LKISVHDLAAKLGGTVHIPAGANVGAISGIAPVDKAGGADVTFLINPDYMKFADQTAAAAVIVGAFTPSTTTTPTTSPGSCTTK
jgi:UDP-3-O-[3-hydroxymyristoyl] glucosamine N-acyltransferase